MMKTNDKQKIYPRFDLSFGMNGAYIFFLKF